MIAALRSERRSLCRCSEVKRVDPSTRSLHLRHVACFHTSRHTRTLENRSSPVCTEQLGPYIAREMHLRSNPHEPHFSFFPCSLTCACRMHSCTPASCNTSVGKFGFNACNFRASRIYAMLHRCAVTAGEKGRCLEG